MASKTAAHKRSAHNRKEHSSGIVFDSAIWGTFRAEDHVQGKGLFFYFSRRCTIYTWAGAGGDLGGVEDERVWFRAEVAEGLQQEPQTGKDGMIWKDWC